MSDVSIHFHRHLFGQRRPFHHEIAHLIVGPGHPDQGGGFAPLQSLAAEEHRKRLMFSDTSAAGRLLVKTEWDKAEKWLTNRPNGDN